jgi:hypothetical protein
MLVPAGPGLAATMPDHPEEDRSTACTFSLLSDLMLHVPLCVDVVMAK